jgi:multidrug efflux system outer membrane protein
MRLAADAAGRRHAGPRAAIVLAAALLGAGCDTMAPPYERPPAPVAPHYPAEPAGPAAPPAAKPAADIAWQDFFADPRLQRLIALALQNNRDLRVAALNIEQARAQVQVQRSYLFPTLQLGATGVSQTGTGDAYTAGFSIASWEIDLFGRIRSLTEASQQQFFAAEANRQAVQISLVAAVANTYVALLADEAQLDVTKRTVETREQTYRLLKLKLDNGAASEYDFAQAAGLYEAARATQALLVRQRAQDLNALVLLVGTPLPDDLPPARALEAQGLLADLPAGLPSELLERRPDLRAAEFQLMAANANIGAARAAFFPTITLTAAAGAASSDLSQLFSSGGWTFAPRITVPIFDAGRNQANLEISEAGREIAVALYQKAIQAAFREVADALAGRATFGEQLRAQRAQLDYEQTRYRLADLRYRNGASSFLDVLEAQRALFQAQQALLVAQASQVQNLVTLYKVLGGGWKAEGG